VKLLLDTHLLLWAANDPARIPAAALTLMRAEESELCFSSASVWEVAIKAALRRPDFNVDPGLLRQGFLDIGWREVAITGEHAILAGALEDLHADPFDRMLIAQAMHEGLLLLTNDAKIARYKGPIRPV
jgi:PIN domain nuclease of toxin-antitoxin system